MPIADNITKTIGKTPLVYLNKLTKDCNAKIAVKIEANNPGNSVKDRIALFMTEEAERKGLISPEKTTIIEPTSGNTGIGLAMICAVKGYRLIVVMPETMSIERRAVIMSYGAEIIITPAGQGMKGAIEYAEYLKKITPNAFIPQQFSNPDNPKAHKETTGPEIWEDTQGNVDIVISGVGTGGTITGIAEYIKPKKPSVKFIAVEPYDSPVLSGGTPAPHKIQGIGAGFIPEILDTSIIDEIIKVTNDQAIETARLLASQEGLLVGISSGAAVFAAVQTAKKPENKDKLIVTILPSHGERYLSTVLFEEILQKAKDLQVKSV